MTLDQRGGSLDHQRVQGGDRGVPEPVDLLVHRLDHRGVEVAEVGDADAAAEVEHVAPVDGVQVRARGTLHHQVGVAAVGRARSARRRAHARRRRCRSPDGKVGHRVPPLIGPRSLRGARPPAA